MENFIHSPPIVYCILSITHYLDTAFPYGKSQIILLGRYSFGKAYLTYWWQAITASVCTKLGFDIHWPALGYNVDIVHCDSRFICHHLPVNHDDILRWIGTTSGTLDNSKGTISQMGQFLSQLIQSTLLNFISEKACCSYKHHQTCIKTSHWNSKVTPFFYGL